MCIQLIQEQAKTTSSTISWHTVRSGTITTVSTFNYQNRISSTAGRKETWLQVVSIATKSSERPMTSSGWNDHSIVSAKGPADCRWTFYTFSLFIVYLMVESQNNETESCDALWSTAAPSDASCRYRWSQLNSWPFSEVNLWFGPASLACCEQLTQQMFSFMVTSTQLQSNHIFVKELHLTWSWLNVNNTEPLSINTHLQLTVWFLLHFTCCQVSTCWFYQSSCFFKYIWSLIMHDFT